MIDPLGSIEINNAAAPEAAKTTRVLRMVKNERMGGSVPMWETVKLDAKKEVEQTLSLAQNGQNVESFDAALAYQASQEPQTQPEEAFGFGDLVDMVNPLHHIPVVGHVYRAISGDQIKSISGIIGGAVFGGPLGAAAGLVDAVIREETGNDLTGNAYSMIAYGQLPRFKSLNTDNPERALNQAAQIAQSQDSYYDDLPAALLAFTPTAYRYKS